jgi:transcriptional regulator with XRE-family HTH domain
MRSRVAQRVLNNTPEETREFMRLYGDIAVRIDALMKKKGFSQKQLAEQLGKKPSEINKWLKNPHNYTLRTLAKLQTVLGGTIVNVPRERKMLSANGTTVNFTVYRSNVPSEKDLQFSPGKISHKKLPKQNEKIA